MYRYIRDSGSKHFDPLSLFGSSEGASPHCERRSHPILHVFPYQSRPYHPFARSEFLELAEYREAVLAAWSYPDLNFEKKSCLQPRLNK